MWKRVVAPTVLVSVLWLVGSGISTYFVHQVYESQASVLTENVATIRAAWAMQDGLWRLQVAVAEASGKEPRETRIETAELQAAFEQRLREAEQSCFTPQERVLSKAVREHYCVYRDHIQECLRDLGAPNPQVTQAEEKEKLIRLARAVAEPCRQLLELNERLLADSTARSTRLNRVTDVLHYAFLVVGPMVGVLCGLWIARGMHRSISQIRVTLKGAAGGLDGELSSVEVHTPGDLPELQHLAQVVTDRVRHVVLELEQARQQAMSTERLAAVGELAAGIAHEMRNPLTSVKLLIQTAAQQLPGGSFGEQDLQVAQREIVRMESTIQGLLDFARPAVLRRVRHDVRGTAQRAWNLVDGRARQQHVHVVYEAPDVPVMVDGDPEQLHQILVNLLLNGVESMPSGGLLRMTIQAGDGRHPACRIAVSDSGAGIPPPILARIFEPFVTSKETGTGLGLAISRRIAEEHGGMLVAANREEGGAQFTLELPTSTAVPGNTASGDGQPGRP